MLTRLAVWGDPIDHSRSPDLHAAAYRALGLDWDYGRQRVAEHEFAHALNALGPRWRGLSLTMPLKQIAHLMAFRRDRYARLTGAVNTYLLGETGPRGFNTDVGGLVRDLRERGFEEIDRARIVGAGSTATSALVAAAELGATEIEVVARRPEAVVALQHLGRDHLGVAVTPVGFFDDAFSPTPLTIAALPGGAEVPEEVAATLAAAGGALYDVVYGQWPSALASGWQQAGNPAWDGLGMLLQQAVLQVRVFVNEDVDAPLPHEETVIAAMRAAFDDDAAVGD